MVFVLFCDYFSVWRFSPRDLRCLKSCVVDAILAILCYSTRGVHDESGLHTNIFSILHTNHFKIAPCHLFFMFFKFFTRHSVRTSHIIALKLDYEIWWEIIKKKHTKCYTANLIEKKQFGSKRWTYVRTLTNKKNLVI